MINGIDIWEISFNEDINLMKSYTCLNDEEQNKAQRFLKKEDKDAYLLTHIALRKILTHYEPSIKEDDWKFDTNDFSKPRIADSFNSDIHFNLSHTSSCAYIILTLYKEVGIDVEEIKPIDLSDELLELALCTNELLHVKKSEDTLKLFYRYWTLKEAHLKALGVGLSTEPSGLDFHKWIEKDSFRIGKDCYWISEVESDLMMSYTVLDASDKIMRNFFTINSLDI